VNSSQGGGSKDTWVLASPQSAEAATHPAALPLLASPQLRKPPVRPARGAAGRQSGPEQ